MPQRLTTQLGPQSYLRQRPDRAMSAPPQSSLHILSWNVLGELRMIESRWPELVRVIHAHFADVDLLCLQEVFDLNFFKSRLSDLFPYRFHADKVSIYSKHPIHDAQVFDLPRAGWPKVLISLKIQINGVELLIANSHFLPSSTAIPTWTRYFSMPRPTNTSESRRWTM